MDSAFLAEPDFEYKDEYIDFYEEWLASGESIVPWVDSRGPSDFEGMLQFLRQNEKGEGIPEDWVPSSTYWFVTENKRVIGAVNIRHRLNEKLLQSGGHIGYGVRPAERQKGYASLLLSLALEKAKELGITKALVACDDWNAVSEKTILKYSGVPVANFREEDGNIVKRFWIATCSIRKSFMHVRQKKRGGSHLFLPQIIQRFGRTPDTRVRRSLPADAAAYPSRLMAANSR